MMYTFWSTLNGLFLQNTPWPPPSLHWSIPAEHSMVYSCKTLHDIRSFLTPFVATSSILANMHPKNYLYIEFLSFYFLNKSKKELKIIPSSLTKVYGTP